MSKWKCEICGSEFENFQAQGFNNKIYCPLCYFKELYKKEKKKNKELERQLKYLRSGEYLNQVLFERDMLQDLIDEEKLSIEVYDIKKITKKNSELLEEKDKLIKENYHLSKQLQQRDEVIDRAIKIIEKDWYKLNTRKIEDIAPMCDFRVFVWNILNDYKGENDE